MQVPQHEEIHPKGHLERYKTVERKKSFHCSAYDIKVVHFQEQESKLSGLEGLERRLDRVSRRSGPTQSVETPRRSCTTRRGSHRRRHNKSVKRLLFDGSSEHIQAKTDLTVEEHDVHRRRWCFLARDGRECSPSAGKKTIRQTKNLENPNHERHRPFHKKKQLFASRSSALVCT